MSRSSRFLWLVCCLAVLLYASPVRATTLEYTDVFKESSVNQAEEFTDHQLFVQRVLAVASSTTSIVFCLASMYSFFAIDPARLVFRHQLIFFLLFFDLLKACILLLYPSRVLSTYTAYFNTNFCHIVGFFTATAIEGADFAILTFAVHTYLLIFRPSLNVKVGNRTEGGLYAYRHYIYGTSFLIPIILASLAFIQDRGYHSFVCWCYLPQSPKWYRMVLSWVPRFLIIASIFTCYSLIYFHVIREYRILGGVFTTLPRRELSSDEPLFFAALKYFFHSIRDQIFPNLLFLDLLTPNNNDRVHRTQSRGPESTRPTFEDEATVGDQLRTEEIDLDDLDDLSSDDEDNVRPTTSSHSPTAYRMDNPSGETISRSTDIQLENLRNFRKRQKVIKKQMKSIFVYPLAYVFIWLFPFVLYITQLTYEKHHKPIYWINCMGAFMQPFNGFIDSLVFFYRERPWKHTVMKTFEKDHSNQMDVLLIKRPSQHSYSFHSSSMSTAPEHRDSTISSEYVGHHNSLSANLGVDYTRFRPWRRVLNDINLPLFGLPTEKNLARLQKKVLARKSKEEKMEEEKPPAAAHDFSNVLQGKLVEDEFRSTLENFSFNFNKRDSTSAASTNPQTRVNSIGNMSPNSERKGSVISQRSFRGRQHSVVDPNEPVIPEEKVYDGPASPTQPKTSPLLRAHRNSYNSGKLIPRRANSGSLTPNKKLSKTTLDTGSIHESEDEEMDFLDFLKRGPPN